jgi:hypothetical protein
MTAKHSGVGKMWLLNLIGNAALVAAVYGWLVLPDARGWQVAVSGLLALIVIFFGLWLRTGSFAYFRLPEFREHAGVWAAFRHALRYILALLLWLIPFAALEWYLLSLRKYAPQFGVWFWQKAPSFLHFGSPRRIFHLADCLLWLLVLAVFPVIWLPIASTVAAYGLRLRRMVRSLRVLKRVSYWVWFCVLLAIGGYIPYKLVWWIPDLSDLRKQAWSMGLRFLLAYVVLISAWIALLLVTGELVEREDPDTSL